MASKISEHEELTQQEQQQTDVESLDGTVVSLNDSSITHVPLSCSDTEFEFPLDQFLDSQFPSKDDQKSSKEVAKNVRGTANVKEVKKEVARWLNISPDDSKLAAPADFRNNIATEEIEKTAAVLKDAIFNEPFKPSAWNEAGTEQQVPSGDFISNFYHEAKERPVLTLMHSIKTYCNGNASTASAPGYLEILQCACRNVNGSQASTLVTRGADFHTLESFERGAYFGELRLSFKKLPKAKRPLVRSVEDFVTEYIKEAQSFKNPVSFTRYDLIPDVVKKCNDEKGLQFDPEKLAKYGIVLQRTVHQEMLGRCLDFLEHVGFTLSPEENNGNERLNLSSNESTSSQPCFSQESQQSDSVGSQESNLIEDIEIGNEYPFQRNNALDNEVDGVVVYDAQNNPEFIEILRGQVDDARSPGGSQRSYNSYGSQSLSPLLYSLPEREPAATIDPNIINQVDGLDEEESFMVFDPEEILLAVENSQGEPLYDYDEDDEPRRRRPRLE